MVLSWVAYLEMLCGLVSQRPPPPSHNARRCQQAPVGLNTKTEELITVKPTYRAR